MIKDFLFNSIPGAFIWLLFGAWNLRDTLKNTNRGDTISPLQPFLSGIIGGIGLILAGVLVIIFKIKEYINW
jgi:hypothetical protein